MRATSAIPAPLPTADSTAGALVSAAPATVVDRSDEVGGAVAATAVGAAPVARPEKRRGKWASLQPSGADGESVAASSVVAVPDTSTVSGPRKRLTNRYEPGHDDRASPTVTERSVTDNATSLGLRRVSTRRAVAPGYSTAARPCASSNADVTVNGASVPSSADEANWKVGVAGGGGGCSPTIAKATTSGASTEPSSTRERDAAVARHHGVMRMSSRPSQLTWPESLTFCTLALIVKVPDVGNV